jgi:hypothetical protein
MSDYARKIGERTADEKPLEWTGDVWAPVCPRDDRPMDGRDGDGWLCCGTCGLRAVDR